MKRLLVVDDEHPVVEAIELMVRRDLSDEFTVAGNASSGREAVEMALALAPDIVLMDIWMPGISGLDAVREIRARGLSCVFILVTAYERFDIAREAMELGVLDYLLKPVAKDKLASALRAAASIADRRFEIEKREMEHREREERLRSFVEEAFLRAVMMDESDRFDAERYRAALGISQPWATVAAAAFLPVPGSPDPEAEARGLYEGFRSTVRYKTRALVGPFMAGFTVVLIPLASSEAAEASIAVFRSVVEQAHEPELAHSILKIGYAPASPLHEANQSWSLAFRETMNLPCITAPASDAAPSAVSRAFGTADGGSASASGWEDARAFVSSLVGGDAGRARVALEQALESLPGGRDVPSPDRYRLIALFAEAYREFERRSYLTLDEAREYMDFEDLRTADGAIGMGISARVRFAALSEASRRAPRWSAPTARAIAYIKENYGRQISLESVAAEIPLSPSHLSRLLVEETGRGFSDFLTEVRMERAKKLLIEPDASIKQVSAACGYPDPNYFSRLFKKVTGCTPTAFSSGHREDTDAEY
ncbi:MAG: response regulator [Spirochaetales bacterium]|nr:response regulator [Spirochaetales bacterium]